MAAYKGKWLVGRCYISQGPKEGAALRLAGVTRRMQREGVLDWCHENINVHLVG